MADFLDLLGLNTNEQFELSATHLPKRDTLDDWVGKLNTDGLNKENPENETKKQFAQNALLLKSWLRTELFKALAPTVEQTQKNADQLIIDAEKIFQKAGHTANRQALIKNYHQSPQFCQSLCDTLQIEQPEVQALLDKVAQSARFMNLGDVDGQLAALLASTRLISPEKRIALFKENFHRSGALMKQLKIADEEDITLVSQVRYGNAPTAASQLLDLFDQLAALTKPRQWRKEPLPQAEVIKRLSQNCERYGIPKPLVDAFIKQYIRARHSTQYLGDQLRPNGRHCAAHHDTAQ